MKLGKYQEKFMRDTSELLLYLFDNGYEVRGGELLRTPEQQSIYMNTGRTQTFRSNHLKKCAIDLFIFKEDEWVTSKEQLQNIGDFWESLDPLNKWGGNYNSFYDGVHFEKRV